MPLTLPAPPARLQPNDDLARPAPVLPAHGGPPRVGETALTSLRHLGELDGAPCYVASWWARRPTRLARNQSARAALAGQTPD